MADFDPVKHPRNTRGEFSSVLDKMEHGVSLPGNISVDRGPRGTRDKGFRVVAEGRVTHHPDAKSAADHALTVSARSTHPDSLGGARSHKDLPAALKANRAKARRGAGKPRDVPNPTRLPSVSNIDHASRDLSKLSNAELTRHMVAPKSARRDAAEAEMRRREKLPAEQHFQEKADRARSRKSGADRDTKAYLEREAQIAERTAAEHARRRTDKRGDGEPTAHVSEKAAPPVVPEADRAREKTLKATGRRDVPQAQLNRESNDLVQQAGQHMATLRDLKPGNTAHFNHETSVANKNGTYHITGHNGRTSTTKDLSEAVLRTQRKQDAAMRAKGIRPHGHGNPQKDWREPTAADHQSLLRVVPTEGGGDLPSAPAIRTKEGYLPTTKTGVPDLSNLVPPEKGGGRTIRGHGTEGTRLNHLGELQKGDSIPFGTSSKGVASGRRATVVSNEGGKIKLTNPSGGVVRGNRNVSPGTQTFKHDSGRLSALTGIPPAPKVTPSDRRNDPAVREGLATQSSPRETRIKADTVKLPAGVKVTNPGKDDSTVTVDGKGYKLTQIRRGKQGEHYQWQTADGEPLARNHSDALWALTNVGHSNVMLSQHPDQAAAELRGPSKGPRAPRFDAKTGRNLDKTQPADAAKSTATPSSRGEVAKLKRAAPTGNKTSLFEGTAPDGKKIQVYQYKNQERRANGTVGTVKWWGASHGAGWSVTKHSNKDSAVRALQEHLRGQSARG